ncbi:quorum-sensing sensor histidine kinase AgrC [Staphylococcus gallinarum]|uniref:quorum-sensing sensor histidine kinase AgrC n=1 Tax=Staphylococcus gallinarum TaxID=1293 RepID=UPI001E638073|nr:GHKL domain-containing protein [Staphylococcus gallinarum]MCD8910648.1 GHKL domain-containing protein [Staphylococcus gallinarum]MCD8921342.1 GHKL domain-containing protein [Staphylococcus gallinarum]MEB6278922.1 GHKL domain-containing protein [Staphylococcus gallinarum]MEB7039843.1 GHKL domain-containing protein [Staphylococcus gallinarum]UEH00499.1 GHKL domain-containing protein [Staphylococcus gallinarum]
MTILSSLTLTIFQAVILFIIIKIINNTAYKLRDYITMIGIIIPSTVVFYFFQSRAMIFLLICTAIFMYFRNRIIGLVSVLISFFILYIANFITTWLATISYNLIESDLLFNLLYILFFAFTTLGFSFISRYFVKKLLSSDLSFNKIYLTIVALFLSTCLLIVYFYLPKEIMSFADIKFLTVMYAVFIITLAILIITISFSIVRQIQYKRNMQEIENYYKYTLQIENINNEMRKFRHDYVNILSTMSEFIRENDMDGLKKYFNEEILPMQDSMQMNAIKINGIENLKVREIKGLLTTKILQAQEKNIRISIEVPEPIDKIDMPIVNLSRAIGIILDNAIEASEKIEDDPLIRIAFIKNNDDSVMFIVMNKCEPDMPRVHTLFKENFSTKGKNRGLGLSTLKELTDTTSNVLLDTTIDNNYFIQKVEILNSNS